MNQHIICCFLLHENWQVFDSSFVQLIAANHVRYEFEFAKQISGELFSDCSITHKPSKLS